MPPPATSASRFCVFKVSGIARHELLTRVSAKSELEEADAVEYAEVVERIDALCKRAADGRTYVLIDAEESWVQDARLEGLELDVLVSAAATNVERSSSPCTGRALLLRRLRATRTAATVTQAIKLPWPR